jgi:tRNA (Thr-GGU) A37 N-methylase
MAGSETYELRPIGVVRASEEGFAVVVDEAYRDGLRLLDGFGHVMVFWWADGCDNPEGRATLVCEPPYAAGRETGVFACRSEARPNPIAVSTCPIMGVDEAAGMVIVPWLDAHDGTPVVDLKAYFPVSDRVKTISMPDHLADWPQWIPESMEDLGDWVPPE